MEIENPFFRRIGVRDSKLDLETFLACGAASDDHEDDGRHAGEDRGFVNGDG